MSHPTFPISHLLFLLSRSITAKEQLDSLVGRGADPDFLERLRYLAASHDERAQLDIVRAYHFGPKFLVEIEIVMDPMTPLHASHDVGIALQHRIEQEEEVERCFVHVDYLCRDVDDHDPLTPLGYKTSEWARLPREEGAKRRSSVEHCRRKQELNAPLSPTAPPTS